MKVILKQDVAKLGRKGDLLEVSTGYARNFLFAKGLAEEGTPARIKEWNEQQKASKAREEKKKQNAIDVKNQINGKKVKVKVQSGDEGRLFGSVTSQQVAEALAAQLQVETDKRDIRMDESIRKVGNYSFRILLHTGIEAELSLVVEAQ